MANVFKSLQMKFLGESYMRPISPKSSFLATFRFLAVVTLALAGLLTAASAQTPVTVYDFSAAPGSGDVASPIPAGVMSQGRDGKLYSATKPGGAFGQGGVFGITSTGTESVPYSFPISGVDGSGCAPGLTLASDGNFYGSCPAGGTDGYGLVYKVTPSGVFTHLHDFAFATDGANPSTPPIQAKDGNFYGVVPSFGPLGAGLVYKLTPTGTFSILFSFNGSNGANPVGTLVQGSDGSLYGTTLGGGTSSSGTVFKVSTAGHLTTLHTFAGTDGGNLYAGVIQGTDGSFYGTTSSGGPNNEGVVYKVTATGKFTLLHAFTSATEGGGPRAEMVQATDGNIYGTTWAVNPDSLFKITPKGVFSVVYSFDGTSGVVGTNPAGGLVQHTNGLLYGTTENSAQSKGNGSVFTLNIGAAPFVRLTLTAGRVASTVSLLGQGFSGSSVVKFGGVSATTVTLAGSTYITATVPVGAHSGPVTVTTGATTLTSNKSFNVTPAITTFSPTTGPVGTSVVIHGSGLIQATTVKFGTIVAPGFTVNSDSQITVLVPAGSAPGQVKIAITTPGGTATSAAKFTVQ
jgi:uncharacterized repeat protein (TIGR03803 family)